MVVYRLVPCSFCDVVNGEWEPQSCAFDNASAENDSDCEDDMSVLLEDRLRELGREADSLPTELDWAGDRWGVAAVPVGYLRNDEGLTVWRTPNAEEAAHGDVCGIKNGGRRKRIRNHATWVIRPAVAPPSTP